MGTRCVIGRLNKNKSIDFIWCHYNGDPGGVGVILYKYYRHKNKLDMLLKLGDLTSLEDDIYWCNLCSDKRLSRHAENFPCFKNLLNYENKVEYVYIIYKHKIFAYAFDYELEQLPNNYIKNILKQNNGKYINIMAVQICTAINKRFDYIRNILSSKQNKQI